VSRRACVWTALAAVFFLGGAPAAFAQPPRPPLIVISLDGFRADYYDRGLTPTLAELARGGVHAASMRPAFPSVTEPNHYTLMTGLYPDHHGIVDNTMVDPNMPGMAFGGPHAQGTNTDTDPRWWDEATPLWVTAERRGLKTASSLWPGDEAVIHGVAPSYLQARPRPMPLIFPMDKQVDTVLGWLDLPPAERPALIRLHFDITDLIGHLLGPDSPQENDAIAKTDAALARLVEGLRTRRLLDAVNIVVVSDHGMANIAATRTLFLDDLIDLKTAATPLKSRRSCSPRATTCNAGGDRTSRRASTTATIRGSRRSSVWPRWAGRSPPARRSPDIRRSTATTATIPPSRPWPLSSWPMARPSGPASPCRRSTTSMSIRCWPGCSASAREPTTAGSPISPRP